MPGPLFFLTDFLLPGSFSRFCSPTETVIYEVFFLLYCAAELDETWIDQWLSSRKILEGIIYAL